MSPLDTGKGLVNPPVAKKETGLEKINLDIEEIEGKIAELEG